jgi:hypothetical protein
MVRRMNKRWAEEHDQQLLELRANGQSLISISAALERTEGAIVSRLNVLKGRLKQAEARRRREYMWHRNRDMPGRSA